MKFDGRPSSLLRRFYNVLKSDEGRKVRTYTTYVVNR